MVIKKLRYLRTENEQVLIFADLANEFEFRIELKKVDSSEMNMLEFGREYLGRCDDQGFWRFEKRS